MEKTARDAAKATAALEEEGKHHIGDFLPPEELSKFMNKYKVLAEHWIATLVAEFLDVLYLCFTYQIVSDIFEKVFGIDFFVNTKVFHFYFL